MRTYIGALGVMLGLCGSGAQAQLVVTAPLLSDRAAVPGEVYEGRVPVYNSSDEPRQARVFVTDYRFDASGANWYDPPGSHPRSSAAWLSLGSDQVLIPPGATVDVPYALTVPRSDSLDGSYWAMLMVEEIPAGSQDGTLPALGVQRRVRYGTQIATHILNGAAPHLEMTDVVLSQEEAKSVLSVAVANEGGLSADTDIYVDLFTTEGASVGRYKGTRLRIYPTTSVRHEVVLEGVLQGEYEALVVIGTEGAEAIGAQFTLNL